VRPPAILPLPLRSIASYIIADPPLHSNVDVLVIGAGPTGLGASKRLNQIVSAEFPPVHTACSKPKLTISTEQPIVADH
jgi:hypothetical protein